MQSADITCLSELSFSIPLSATERLRLLGSVRFAGGVGAQGGFNSPLVGHDLLTGDCEI